MKYVKKRDWTWPVEGKMLEHREMWLAISAGSDMKEILWKHNFHDLFKDEVDRMKRSQYI